MRANHPPPSLGTARLHLRRMRFSDARAMFELESDPRITRFLVMPTQQTIADAERHARERVAAWDEGLRWTYAITLKGDDRAVGRIGFKANPDGISIGYAIAHHLHGQGLVPEAVLALSPVGHTLSERFFARVDAENAPSMRVLEKCGFVFSERRAKSLVMPNIGLEPRDCLIYVRPP